MKFFFDSGAPQENAPIMTTKVLNTAECGIGWVGATFTGRLCYKPHWWSARGWDIKSILFLQSKVNRRMPQANMVEADFDIYLNDGRVIEVHTCDRRVIEAALRLVPVPDIRDRFRAARRGG